MLKILIQMVMVLETMLIQMMTVTDGPMQMRLLVDKILQLIQTEMVFVM